MLLAPMRLFLLDRYAQLWVPSDKDSEIRGWSSGEQESLQKMDHTSLGLDAAGRSTCQDPGF